MNYLLIPDVVLKHQYIIQNEEVNFKPYRFTSIYI